MAASAPGILLVEPDLATRGALATLFEDAGYAVTPATGWEQAKVLVTCLRPGLDVVVCEPLQPGIPLPTVLRWLETDDALQTLPVLICTVAVTARDLMWQHAARTGQDVLFKPFDIADILAAVARLLNTTARE